jgi:hypothetical protein
MCARRGANGQRPRVSCPRRGACTRASRATPALYSFCRHTTAIHNHPYDEYVRPRMRRAHPEIAPQTRRLVRGWRGGQGWLCMAIWTDPASRIEGSFTDSFSCARASGAPWRQLMSGACTPCMSCRACASGAPRRQQLSGVHVAWSHACITPWALRDRSHVRCQ